ncbi:Na+/H+-dicarboxylate symporter [Alkalispirochaeta americana]|uniref:Na+/H+-dicarboxylate symporter n=1 Tax=Alkalispirochaeta americana TaxID=159291 RepID=A0A1N6RY54_9SPIO|nr:cation:dicarboxylase symporter family transporter [Alkalispirochaeta americana]SIQ33765.1 Na+/H+-dicarboxylate symporter [Alkalispirochaeta americana]
MNISFRYALGASAGVLLGMVLPLAGGDTAALLTELSQLVILAGRFLLFPLVFFAMIAAVDELHTKGALGKAGMLSAVVLFLCTVVSTLLGGLAILAFSPQRIPPMVQEGRITAPPSLIASFLEAIPANAFRVFVLDDGALAGILLMALLVGVSFKHDRSVSSPLSLVVDSANRIFYRMNRLLVGILGVLVLLPVAALTVLLRDGADLGLFSQFLLVLIVAVLVMAVLVYPAILYLFDRRRTHPLRWLSAMIPVAVAALGSGDSFFSLATLTRVNRDSLEIPRAVGASVSPWVALYGRAGTALVSMAGFLLVIRSYTALDIGLGDLMLLTVSTVLYSFFLARTPAGGVLLMLSFLASRYGRGMEESYLILLPVMPLLERIGAFLDMMTAGFVTQIAATRGQGEPRR